MQLSDAEKLASKSRHDLGRALVGAGFDMTRVREIQGSFNSLSALMSAVHGIVCDFPFTNSELLRLLEIVLPDSLLKVCAKLFCF